MAKSVTTMIAVLALAAGLSAKHGKTDTTSLTGTWNMGLQGGHVIPVALVLKQDGSGGHTVTYPASVKWDNDNVPWMSSLAAAGVLTTYLYISSLTK